MPLASKRGIPARKYDKPQPSALSRRRCLGIVTRATLEDMKARCIINADEYAYYDKLLKEMEHGKE